MLIVALAPAAAAGGGGELVASFQAGPGGGIAIEITSGAAASVASPKIDPEGRLEPFAAPEFVCDELVVGTWVFWIDPSRDALDAVTNKFKLDGVPLDTVRTPLKRITQGAGKGQWWFAEGVPVYGTLDEGLHEIEHSIDDGFGFFATFNTPVDVDSAHW